MQFSRRKFLAALGLAPATNLPEARKAVAKKSAPSLDHFGLGKPLYAGEWLSDLIVTEGNKYRPPETFVLVMLSRSDGRLFAMKTRQYDEVTAGSCEAAKLSAQIRLAKALFAENPQFLRFHGEIAKIAVPFPFEIVSRALDRWGMAYVAT